MTTTPVFLLIPSSNQRCSCFSCTFVQKTCVLFNTDSQMSPGTDTENNGSKPVPSSQIFDVKSKTTANKVSSDSFFMLHRLFVVFSFCCLNILNVFVISVSASNFIRTTEVQSWVSNSAGGLLKTSFQKSFLFIY